MSRTAGLKALGLLVLGVVALLVPVIAPDPATTNVAVFTMMYIGLATAWNIMGGYTGYVSLGHAGFFGIGCYAVGLVVQHAGVAAGYGPFLVVPVGGLVAAASAIPIAWVALRTRAASFVIVTIAFMFMLQILATNLRGVTGGSQGLAYPVPYQWPPGFFDIPFYYAMLGLAGLLLGHDRPQQEAHQQEEQPEAEIAGDGVQAHTTDTGTL